jgi:hypothetical protein
MITTEIYIGITQPISAENMGNGCESTFGASSEDIKRKKRYRTKRQKTGGNSENPWLIGGSELAA